MAASAVQAAIGFEYLYRFKIEVAHAGKVSHKTYMVRVEEIAPKLFGVKFHDKNHNGIDKYRTLTHVGVYNALRILATCVKVTRQTLDANPGASFGFVGMNAYNGDPNGNFEPTLHFTKRFRVYREITKRYFPEHEGWHHIIDEETSGYLVMHPTTSQSLPERSAMLSLFASTLVKIEESHASWLHNINTRKKGRHRW